ncbi:hypothetical protein PI125_g951 [Phytophthora idaei]|nr:hypothetical protein PI125_g951 [Phytophthora idaei]
MDGGGISPIDSHDTCTMARASIQPLARTLEGVKWSDGLIPSSIEKGKRGWPQLAIPSAGARRTCLFKQVKPQR